MGTRRGWLTLTERPLPERTKAVLSDAWDCWIAGLFTPAIVMCRAVIDHSLTDLQERQPWIEIPNHPKLAQLISRCPHLPRDLKGIAEWINGLANGLLHFEKPADRPGEEDTYRALRGAARIVERLNSVTDRGTG